MDRDLILIHMLSHTWNWAIAVGTVRHWLLGARTLPNEAVLVGPPGTAQPACCLDLYMAGAGMRTGPWLRHPPQAQKTHSHALQAVFPQLLREQPWGQRESRGQDHTQLWAFQRTCVQLQPRHHLQRWGEHQCRPLHDQGETGVLLLIKFSYLSFEGRWWMGWFTGSLVSINPIPDTWWLLYSKFNKWANTHCLPQWAADRLKDPYLHDGTDISSRHTLQMQHGTFRTKPITLFIVCCTLHSLALPAC